MDRRSQQGLDLELKPVMRIDETELQILWGVGSYFNRICEAKNGYASPLGENDKNFHHLNTRMYFPFFDEVDATSCNCNFTIKIHH